MIGYTTVGTNDLPRATAFYDAVLGVLGAQRIMTFERGYAWGVSMDKPGFGLLTPFNGQPATVGNGTMIALACDTPERVQAVYSKALELGGTDEGAPGQRGGPFYAAYFRDLDGNKLNAFCMLKG
jgi:catechol 2,3-dioxygenase-like lactoylglutathione lyase family enzyme